MSSLLARRLITESRFWMIFSSIFSVKSMCRTSLMNSPGILTGMGTIADAVPGLASV